MVFGSNGGRVTEPSGVASAAPTTPPPPDGREPVTDLFTRREVVKLLGVSETRLRSLDRAAIVSPSGQRGKQRAYTFQDLIALRATRELLEQQVRLRDVARAIGALRATLPTRHASPPGAAHRRRRAARRRPVRRGQLRAGDRADGARLPGAVAPRRRRAHAASRDHRLARADRVRHSTSKRARSTRIPPPTTRPRSSTPAPSGSIHRSPSRTRTSGTSGFAAATRPEPRSSIGAPSRSIRGSPRPTTTSGT